ncbi:ribosome maturation factor RimP [Rhodohalobacter halophilus]|uniref:ribosome maturation factor RimP n=1 Tax=Rhodohalobacter halophilus TaxID=1812810 RepID=UPI00083FBFB4|nr:ribosome maturation factor [Rhodohalobacter halophilus]
MNQTVKNRILELVEPIVEQEGIFLVDVEVKNAKVMEVWVLVDSEKGGVNLDTCGRVSRELGHLLEEEEVFSKAYRLNVSSPGLSRPLSDKRQYPKNEGRIAKVKYKDQENYLTVEGVLTSVSDTQIEITPKDDKTVTIPFDHIVETKIVPKI